MKVFATVCDFCGNPLPVKKEKDILGVKHEVIARGNLNNVYKSISVDLSKFGYDCCELCATKIDLMVTNFKSKNLNI